MSSNSFVRKTAKATVLPAGAVTRRRAGDLVILLYHRVGVGDREIDLPEQSFEAQIGHLATAESVVTLDETLATHDGGVVVTIDDGFRDFYDKALPALETYRVPALLYLTTGYVENGSGDQALTWSQLSDAVSTGLITIGAHTHGHADLSHAGEAEAENEMRRSKEMIEDRLGIACKHFAYPWGAASKGAERAAKRLFDSAALRAWQTNRKGRIDRYRLGRTPVLRNDNKFFFRAKVKGLLDAEQVWYRALRRGPWDKRPKS